jgi:hypothetical protein
MKQISMMSLPLILFSLFLFTSCQPSGGSRIDLLSPQIQNIAIENNTQGGPIIAGRTRVSAQISIPGISQLHLREMMLAFRSTREEGNEFITVGEMHSNNGIYQRRLPALNFGPYELRITARLRRVNTDGSINPSPDTVITAHEHFRIQASDECFTFDTSAEGWARGPLHDAGTQAEIEGPGCQSSISNFDGRLVVNVGIQSCYPDEVPDNDFWYFDLISPELSANKLWQNSLGAVTRINANVPLQIQPLLTYQNQGGQETTLYIQEDDGSALFHQIGDSFFSFHDLFSEFDVPDNVIVTKFRVRVFGRPGDTSGPGAFTSVTTVCPLVRNRPLILRRVFPVLPVPPFSEKFLN